MGLYDRYRIAQSSLVAQPKGSASQDFVKVASTLQDRYDTAVGISDELGRQLQNAPVREEDRPAFEEMKKRFQAGIGDLAKKGDYENAVRPLSNMAKDFSGEYNHFANQIKAEQAYDQQLQEYFEKGIIKDVNNIARYKAASKKMSTGLSKDPVTGRYKGGFSGMQAAKEIDYNEVTNKILQHIKADKSFAAGLGIQDDNYRKNITSIEQLGPGKIDAAIAAYTQIDPEYRGYVQNMKRLKASEVDPMAFQRLMPRDQEKITERAAAAGMDPQEYMVASAAAGEEQKIFGNLIQLGRKAVYQDVKQDFDIMGLTPEGRAREAAKKAPPILAPGLGGHTGIADTNVAGALSNGEAKISGWDAIINPVIAGIKDISSWMLPGIGGIYMRGMSDKDKGNSRDLPNNTKVSEHQYRAMKPAADAYARQRHSKTLNADDWTKAQADLKARAGYNVGTEVITDPDQLKSFTELAKTGDAFESFPVKVLTKDGWKPYSGLSAAMKDLGIKGTVKEVRENITVAGAISPNNPEMPGGLKVSLPKDSKDATAGNMEIAVMVPPEQMYRNQPDGGAAAASHARLVHEISRQYYGQDTGAIKNDGLANGVHWKYRRDLGKIELYVPPTRNKKTGVIEQPAQTGMIDAPQIASE